MELVDDLADLQAIERPDFNPVMEDIDLADIARRAAGLLAVKASDHQIRIEAPNADETLPAVGEFRRALRSEEHTSELQSLMRISYAVFCLKKTKNILHLTLQQPQNTNTTP